MLDHWSSFARVFSRPADGPLQHGCIEISTLFHPDRKAKEPLSVAQVRGGEGDGAKGRVGLCARVVPRPSLPLSRAKLGVPKRFRGVGKRALRSSSVACDVDGDDAKDADAHEGRAGEPHRPVESGVAPGEDDLGIVPGKGSMDEAVEDEGQGKRH
jgi:hypothetical protein